MSSSPSVPRTVPSELPTNQRRTIQQSGACKNRLPIIFLPFEKNYVYLHRNEKPRDHKTRLWPRTAGSWCLWPHGLCHSGGTGGAAERMRIGDSAPAGEMRQSNAGSLPRGNGEYRCFTNTIHHTTTPFGTIYSHSCRSWSRYGHRDRKSIITTAGKTSCRHSDGTRCRCTQYPCETYSSTIIKHPTFNHHAPCT